MARSGSYRSIQTTIALASAGLVLAAVAVIAVLSYTFTREAVTQTSKDYTGQLIGQIQANIESYVTHMENIAEVVHFNSDVQEYFRRAPDLLPGEARRYRENITGFLGSISQTRKDISLILIAGFDGSVFTHNADIELNQAAEITEQRWFTAAREKRGEAVVSSSHVQNIVDGAYRWVITLSRTIYDVKTGEPFGVLLVDLNFSVINDLVNRVSLGNRGYLFIVDSAGGIVYHPRQELIYSDLEREYIDRSLEVREGSFVINDGKGARIYTVRTLPRTGWRIVGVNYLSELVQNRATIQRYYTYSGLVCVMLALLMSILISHRISKPIKRLRESIQDVERGNFDIHVEASNRNEVDELAKDFNIMVAQIKDLMERNAREQELKRRSELSALQNQITPHFLYNTLDSVIWMAEGRQYANVIETISALARLLRLSISRGDELISVQDEIDHVTSYLTIQKLRYRDKLDFRIGLDPDMRAYRIPKVILQPLAENAIYHGIKNKHGSGQITVTGSLRDGIAVLEVADDGIGMSEDQRSRMLDDGSGGDAGARLGPGDGNGASGSAAPFPGLRASGGLSRRRPRVGVRNVHERIQLYFGRAYGLSFHHRDGGGTLVRVTLPVIDDEQRQSDGHGQNDEPGQNEGQRQSDGRPAAGKQGEGGE